MITMTKYVVAIYVDRATGQWIVRDPDGNFWMVPSTEEAWESRRPFEPTQDSELSPVPGHYKYLLQLPF